MASKLMSSYKVTDGPKFRLKDVDPADTQDVQSKETASRLLQKEVVKLTELQEKLYADNHWALLLIFQGMDASGKDSVIKHVMSGINPQGCEVYSFKAPSDQELDHDFMWRTTRCLPERGRIGVFNRSYYEEVLVVRVHPEILQRQKIPPQFVGKNIWNERCEDIKAHERFLTRNGVVIRKFFLHVSKEEQKRRFLKRLDQPEKNWKFSATDVQERNYWDDYMHACEQMVQQTSTKDAPWFVVPADHKWFSRLTVARAVVDTLESLNLHFPEVNPAKRAELAAIRKALED